MKNFTLELNKETTDYLQRLAYEVMTRKDVVAHMLESAKDDTDASVLDSVPLSIITNCLKRLSVPTTLLKLS